MARPYKKDKEYNERDALNAEAAREAKRLNKLNKVNSLGNAGYKQKPKPPLTSDPLAAPEKKQKSSLPLANQSTPRQKRSYIRSRHYINEHGEAVFTTDLDHEPPPPTPPPPEPYDPFIDFEPNHHIQLTDPRRPYLPDCVADNPFE